MFELLFKITWLSIILITFILLYIKGKKIAEKFPDINKEKIVYRDKWASGFDAQNDRLDTVRGILDVIVTDSELWLKSRVLSNAIVKKFNLIHKVPLANILNVNQNNKRVVIAFRNQHGEVTVVDLKIKNVNKFISAVPKE